MPFYQDKNESIILHIGTISALDKLRVKKGVSDVNITKE